MKTPVPVIVTVVAVCAAFIAFVAMLVNPVPTAALPDYASKTGQACGVCHVSPTGGGPRTALGQRFEAIATRAADPAGAFAQAQAAAQPTAAPPAPAATPAAPPAATPAAPPAAAPTAAAKPAATPTTAPPAAAPAPATLPRTGGFPLTPVAAGGGALLAAIGWTLRKALNR